MCFLNLALSIRENNARQLATCIEISQAITRLTIYYYGSNVVQVCSFIKPWIICSNMHEQACQQQCSSWPAQPCSSMSTGKNKLCIFTSVLHEVILYSFLCIRGAIRTNLLIFLKIYTVHNFWEMLNGLLCRSSFQNYFQHVHIL